MRKTPFLFFLLFVLFFFSFIISSNSLITKVINTDNTYNITIPQSNQKQQYLISIGHLLPLNWSFYQIGETPTNFAQKSIGMFCKLFVDNAFTYPEKVLRYYDIGGSSGITTVFGLKNQSFYQGYTDFIIYSNSTMIDSHRIMVQLYNSSLLNNKIFDIWVGSFLQENLQITINYYLAGISHQKNYIFPYEHIIFISVYWNFLYNIQNVVGKFKNSSIAFNYTTTLDMFPFNAQLYASSLWLKISSQNFDFCDEMILGVDSSIYPNYYRYRSFNFSNIETYGYYSSISYNIPLIPFENILNPRISSGNITFLILNNIKSYTWIDIRNSRINPIVNSRYLVTNTNQSSLSTLFQYFDMNDKNSETIQIHVKMTIYYDYLNEALINIYITALMPFCLLFSIPYFCYWISKKRNFIFWISLFVSDIILTIYYNLIGNLGAIVAIASFFIIFFTKIKDEG